MEVIVDASIFTREGGAYGNVSGSLELSFEPQIGDTISFLPNARSGPCPAGFTATLRVTERILAAGGDKHGLLVQLEDIKVDAVADAATLSAFFQEGFGLFVNAFDEPA
jgi:hypothetical protein